MTRADVRRPARRRWLSRLVIAVAVLALLAVALWFGLTGTVPDIAERPPPTAEQVSAGRDAAFQLRASRIDARGVARVDFGPAQLDGIAALASHGFRPDRLAATLAGGTLTVRGSHRLPGGRWLNAGVATNGGGGDGFPPVRLTVGPVTLGPTLSRITLQTGRLLLKLRRVSLPPLDRMVRDVAIRGDRVTAMVSLPSRTGMVDEFAGATPQPADATLTVDVYCRLAGVQRSRPVTTLTELLHRAFATPDARVAPTEYNRAALVALAMLVVDDRAGDLAGSARADSEKCRIAPIPVTIWGRTDWPKHWTLSAALAVGAGTQLSEALGEWKELADSLSKQAQFAVGDPSGFSFADLSADRSGFRTARAAIDPARADRTAAWLRGIDPEHLLPKPLTEREDGLTNADFVARYGGLSDRRFTARVAEIDRTLDQAGVPDER